MRDIVGEKTALDQTRIIIKGIDQKQLSGHAYKKLVQTIFENQLKNFTSYGRHQRRKLVRETFR